MPTLTEYAKLSNSAMEAGIQENLATADQLTAVLEFESMEGNALLYNRENALPTATTHAVGDIWTDTEPTFTQKSAALTILGVQSPLDRYVMQTRSNIQSQEAALRSSMLKALSRKIAQHAIQGEPENVSTQFEGLDSLIRSETRMRAMDDGVQDGPGTAETEVTIDRLEVVIDDIEGGVAGTSKPDYLIMNKTMRRKLTALSRVAGSGVVMNQINLFGHQVDIYDGIPIIITDWVTNAETYNDAGTWPSSTATTIFACQLGKKKQGYTVLHNGPVVTPDVQPIGIKTDKNENLYRIVVYLQTITYSALKVAALGGIDSAS